MSIMSAKFNISEIRAQFLSLSREINDCPSAIRQAVNGVAADKGAELICCKGENGSP